MNRLIVRLLSCLLPTKQLRKQFRNRYLKGFIKEYAQQLQKNTQQLKILQKQVSIGKKIRVAFLVVFDSVFPAMPLYEKMKKDDHFDPFIVIIPDTLRGKDNMVKTQYQTYEYLAKKFKNDIDNIKIAYNDKQDKYMDISNLCDISISANPYTKMTHRFYSVEYLNDQGVLSLFISYGYMPDFYAREYIINLPSLNFCWKVCADTLENFNDYKKYTDIRGKNVILSGYCKMDDLSLAKFIPHKRKKIIIAPHHTVIPGVYNLSNFLTYSDFFLQLPNKYPEIDFIFRPHPILYVTLCRSDVWGKEKTDFYFKKIQQNSNLIYQKGGDYFETFINSDGIIHDCSSFLVEYLFVEKPCCYMLKSPKDITHVFMKLGRNCLKQYYKAYNEADIQKFIEEVIVQGKDYMQEQRHNFVQKHLKINYPNVSEYIINTIKQELNIF